ncbi:acyl carrier protein [Celeribacter marinus]|uniref:acyl carrier protein n=1 Tax=Celeribacter marinus TaxID=1397108 RepID=UPI00321C7423
MTEQPPVEQMQSVLDVAMTYVSEDLTPQDASAMSIAKLGLDSLSLIEMQLEVEERFGLELDVDALSSDQTLAELIASLTPIDG